LKSVLIAIVVPDPDTVGPWAAENGLSSDMAELCKNPAVNKLILDDMVIKGKSNRLAGFEFIKAIHLHPDPFSTDNELLTPTFKLKRPQAKKAFLEPLSEMYENFD